MNRLLNEVWLKVALVSTLDTPLVNVVTTADGTAFTRNADGTAFTLVTPLEDGVWKKISGAKVTGVNHSEIDRKKEETNISMELSMELGGCQPLWISLSLPESLSRSKLWLGL